MSWAPGHREAMISFAHWLLYDALDFNWLALIGLNDKNNPSLNFPPVHPWETVHTRVHNMQKQPTSCRVNSCRPRNYGGLQPIICIIISKVSAAMDRMQKHLLVMKQRSLG